jgi:hypothetical protein
MHLSKRQAALRFFGATGATLRTYTLSHIASLTLFLPATATSATGHGFLGTFADTGIRAGTLTTYRQVATVTQTAIAPDFDQALDVHLNGAAQVTFNNEVLGYVFAQYSSFRLS